MHQIPGFSEKLEEWAVDRISSHTSKGEDALFKVQWQTGNITWLTHSEAKHLEALSAYCEAMGINNPKHLPCGHTQSEGTDEHMTLTLIMIDVELACENKDLHGTNVRIKAKGNKGKQLTIVESNK